jgi:hypothetical protein
MLLDCWPEAWYGAALADRKSGVIRHYHRSARLLFGFGMPATPLQMFFLCRSRLG